MIVLENDNRSLRNAIDAQEQYSRRNGLLLQGITEKTKIPTKRSWPHATTTLGCNYHKTTLTEVTVWGGGYRPDLNINDATRKPRPIVVKFTNYESRKKITSKRKLKGTKLIITEHLSKRRI